MPQIKKRKPQDAVVSNVKMLRLEVRLLQKKVHRMDKEIHALEKRLSPGARVSR